MQNIPHKFLKLEEKAKKYFRTRRVEFMFNSSHLIKFKQNVELKKKMFGS